MKFKGQIVSVDAAPGEGHRFIVNIAAAGMKHGSGRDQEVFVELALKAPRGAVREFALGDFFEITVEKVEV